MMGAALLLSSAGVGAALMRMRSRSVRVSAVQYVPFSSDQDSPLPDCVVVDCTHPQAQTLTHHKNDNNVLGVPPADSSTGIVLNALAVTDATPDLEKALEKSKVTVNHFDADALLSAWSWINRDIAANYSSLLRCAARIGDFREALFAQQYPIPDVSPAEALQDGVAFDDETVDRALRLSCWINTQEASRFTSPYGDKDSEQKFPFFLQNLLKVLESGPAEDEYMDEYSQVKTGLEAVRTEGRVQHHHHLGLTCIHAPAPLHYYSLFSWTAGSDVVVAMYGGSRYEVECKYTQYVNLHSRPVWPRIEMAPLAEVLNALEDWWRDQSGQREPDSAALRWGCPRIVDTGPVLRLDVPQQPLSKRERYGNPCSRRIHASQIPVEKFETVVLSFFQKALEGCKPRVGGWDWPSMHTYNKGLDLAEWKASALAGR